MKLSIIIPTYNRVLPLSLCLHALKSQTVADFEVIVCDDGSSDGTEKLIRKFKTDYPLTYFKTDHHGAGTARNKAAGKAKGEILVFIDADMEPHPEYLKKLIAPIVAGTSKGTFSKEEYVQNSMNKWAMCWNYEYIHEKSDRRLPARHPDTSPVFRALLKSEFDRAGGYDPVGYGEDWTLSAKLGYLAVQAPDAIIYHRNPATANEVFFQARWLATRPHKLGEFGRFIGLLRASLPVSLIMAIWGMIRYRTAFYPVFKLVYDWGIFTGIIKWWVTGNHAA